MEHSFMKFKISFLLCVLLRYFLNFELAVCESVNRGVSIANILIDRLSKENPYIKWKVMRIIEV